MSDIKIAVVTSEKEIASLFIGDVCGTPGLEGTATLEGRTVKLETALVQPDTGFDGPGAPLADAAPGAYRLVVGLYDPATGQRLLTMGGEDAVELATWPAP